MQFMRSLKEFLHLFPIGDVSSFSLSDPDLPQSSVPVSSDVVDQIRAIITSKQVLFTEDFFNCRYYGLSTLYEAAELFGTAKITEKYSQLIN